MHIPIYPDTFRLDYSDIGIKINYKYKGFLVFLRRFRGIVTFKTEDIDCISPT